MYVPYVRTGNVANRILQAKYAYRSIAQFVKHVTDNSSEHLLRNPFPELHRPPSEISGSESEDEARPSGKHPSSKFRRSQHAKHPKPASGPLGSADSEGDRTDVELYRSNEATAEREVKQGQAEKLPSDTSSRMARESSGEVGAIGRN